MLSAAIQAVEEVGYTRMTVAQVISRAKVSRKTFYDVFIDREDCFLAAFDQTIARARTRVTDVYARQPSWRDGIRAALEALLELMEREPGLARLAVVEALAAGPRILESRAVVLAELAGAVDRGRSAARPAMAPRRSRPKGSSGRSSPCCTRACSSATASR